MGGTEAALLLGEIQRMAKSPRRPKREPARFTSLDTSAVEQSKIVLSDVKLDVHELPERRGSSEPTTAKSPPPESRIQKNPYIVYVANRSTWEIIGVQVGATGEPLGLPEPIGKTCDDTCDECVRQKQFKWVYSVDCTADPFDIYLHLQNDGRFYRTQNPVRVSPNCDEDGMCFCFDSP